MQLKRITDLQEGLLDPLLSLYEESFPVEERRPITQLQKLICPKNEMYFNAILDEEEICGLFVYWDFKDFLYLEHLAVFPAMRNKKIGSKLLTFLAENQQGIHLLEVEPPLTEMAERRIGYYRRNGYEVLEKAFIQPSYTNNEDAMPLWIMGNRVTDRLTEFIETIKREVYVKNRHLTGQ